MAKATSCDTGKVDIEALKNAVRALESPRAKRERERVAVFSALYHDIRDQVSMGVSKSLILKTLIEHGISISNAVLGVRLKSWTGYAAILRLSRYSRGLRKPSEILIRVALYHRM